MQQVEFISTFGPPWAVTPNNSGSTLGQKRVQKGSFPVKNFGIRSISGPGALWCWPHPSPILFFRFFDFDSYKKKSLSQWISVFSFGSIRSRFLGSQILVLRSRFRFSVLGSLDSYKNFVSYKKNFWSNSGSTSRSTSRSISGSVPGFGSRIRSLKVSYNFEP